jgi:DNA invertase Pin-like site-specific DNA recombinase
VFSELERGMIAKRLRDGRAFKRLHGGYAEGGPPYGYRAEGGELVPEPKEQAALKLMRRWRKEGKSLRAIATALMEHGYQPARGNQWHPQVIKQILDRGKVGQ